MQPPNDSKKRQESAAGDLIIGMFLLGLSIFVFIESLRMPEKGGWGFFMGPGFLPLILSVVLFLLTSSMLIASIGRQGISGIIPLFQRLKGSFEFRRSLVIAGWTWIYVALIGTFPFIIVNFIYFLGIFLYLNIGKIWKIVLLSLGSSILVGYLIPRIFDMPLP